jgi:hypothetical protein
MRTGSRSKKTTHNAKKRKVRYGLKAAPASETCLDTQLWNAWEVKTTIKSLMKSDNQYHTLLTTDIIANIHYTEWLL